MTTTPDDAMPDEVIVCSPAVSMNNGVSVRLCISGDIGTLTGESARYTRAQPVADDAGGDVQAWVKAEPHGTYEGLKLQFYSLKSMINSMGQQLSFYMNKSYETGEKHLSALQESLESERAMNAALTEELAALSSPQTPADLIDAARAVIARWDTPAWKESEPTAEVIDRLRMAVDAVPPPQPDPRAEAMGMMVEALEKIGHSGHHGKERAYSQRMIAQAALAHPAVKPFIKGRG